MRLFTRIKDNRRACLTEWAFQHPDAYAFCVSLLISWVRFPTRFGLWRRVGFLEWAYHQSCVCLLGSSDISLASLPSQGLVNVEGRNVDINEFTISGGRDIAGAQASPARSIHQGLANVEGRQVDINELTISLARVCCGSSGISWASLSTRVWLMRRGGRLGSGIKR